MPEYSKEIHDQEMIGLTKTFIGFLVGMGTIVTIWFVGGLYVILK